MSPIIAKRCRICGDDVSSKKRTKDATGNYYCHGCYAESVHVQEQEQDGIDLNALAALEPSSEFQDEGDPLAQLAAMANAAPVDQPEIFMCPICMKYFTTPGMHYSGVCVKCSSPRSSVPKGPATARRRRKIPVFVIVLACAVFGLVAVLLIPSHHQDSTDDETDGRPSVAPVGVDSQTATASKDAQIAQEKRDEATREIEQRDAAQREAEESRERALAAGPLRAAVLNYAAAKLDFDRASAAAKAAEIAIDRATNEWMRTGVDRTSSANAAGFKAQTDITLAESKLREWTTYLQTLDQSDLKIVARALEQDASIDSDSRRVISQYPW